MRTMILLGLLPGLVQTAYAQDVPVTGSHIAGVPSLEQVRVIERAELQASGYANFGDFLQRLPEQGAALSPNVNNGGDGSTQLALHNLGSLRTLVLVDGKRWVPYATSGAVDLATIPTAAIERIEILESGGSAIYGSGAMAGVINVITRKRATGTEASALGGLSSRGDARQYDLSVTSGVAGDKTSFFFGAGFFDREALLSGARGFASQSLVYDFAGRTVSTGGSPILPFTTVTSFLGGCTTQLCRDLAKAFGSANLRNIVFAGSCTGCVDGFRLPRPGELYDFQADNDLVTPGQQLSLFSNAEIRFSPIARAYLQGSYVGRRSNNLLAAEPLQSATIDASNAFNPFGEGVDVSRRIVEASGRSLGEDLDTLRAVAGIDGGLPSGLTFDLSFNYGRTSGTQTTDGTLQRAFIDNALGPSFTDASGLHCGTQAGGAIAGCVPVSLFGTLAEKELASLGLHTGISRSIAQLASLRLDLTQALFPLGPAREATLAVGYEYRAEYGGFSPDPVARAGQDTDFGGAPFTGSFHSNEGYAELDVPLLSQLDLRGALRATDDSGFGAAATWQGGARWQPLRGLMVHGTWSTAIRAPTIDERFDTVLVTLPCDNGCFQRAQGQAGNPRLQPERSSNATAGVSFEPQFARGLFVSFGYWNIAVTRAISIPGCAGETSVCNPNGPETNAGGVITSGLDLGARYSLPSSLGRFGLRAGLSYLLRYDETFAGGQVVSAAGNYDLGTSSVLGGLTPRVKLDAALDWRLGDVVAGLSGRFIGGFDECADLAGGNAAAGRCSAAFTTGQAGQPFPAHRVPAYLTLDLFASYTIGGTSLSAGIHNLADANPPQVYDSFLTFADPAYDLVGRSIYARATQRF
jgi:iron complex outermembrane receptor protein